MTNLIGNASKYTPEGGSIALSLQVDSPWVVMMVADDGIGITPEALSQVFEPFVQERHASEFNGSGLGLGHYRTSRRLGSRRERMEFAQDQLHAQGSACIPRERRTCRL